MRLATRVVWLMTLTALVACGGGSSNPAAPSGSSGSGSGSTTPTQLGPPQLSVEVSFESTSSGAQGFGEGTPLQRRSTTVNVSVSNGIDSLPATVRAISLIMNLIPGDDSSNVERSPRNFESFEVGTGQIVMRSYDLRFSLETTRTDILANPSNNPLGNFQLTLAYDYSGGSSQVMTNGTFDTGTTRRPIADCEESDSNACISLSDVRLKVSVRYQDTESTRYMPAMVSERYMDGAWFSLDGTHPYDVYLQIGDYKCDTENTFGVYAYADTPMPLKLKVTNVPFNVTAQYLKPAEPQQAEQYFRMLCNF